MHCSIVSISMPRNVTLVAGLTVFSLAMGTPISSNRPNKVFIQSEAISKDGAARRKSSK